MTDGIQFEAKRLPFWLDVARRAVSTHWRRLSLARQFVLCALLVFLPATAIAGYWITKLIEDGATRSAATAAALYMENFVEPHVQDLATSTTLSATSKTQLGQLLTDTSLGQEVTSFKIWDKSGLVIFSSRPELIGQRFPPSAKLIEAWTGVVSAEFDKLSGAESVGERAAGLPMTEIYMPMRARGTDQIIAVAEFYQKGEELQQNMRNAARTAWMAVSLATLAMLTALFAIVARGSKTIETQQASLHNRVRELTDLLAENRNLRGRVQLASARTTENNERFLRRLGADLHDGPAQLLALALLKLEDRDSGALPARSSSQDQERTHITQPSNRAVRDVLKEALQEIRTLAAGFAVPDIDDQTLYGTLKSALARHEVLTGVPVRFAMEAIHCEVQDAAKLCAYRFVQEGLSNAFRHAKGSTPTVSLSRVGDNLQLIVADTGPTKPERRTNDAASKPITPGLGLSGLRDRIESIGGTFKIETLASGGTRLTALLPMATGA